MKTLKLESLSDGEQLDMTEPLSNWSTCGDAVKFRNATPEDEI